MDDTKLIELAGKAAGEIYTPESNPLESDALALRLAVKLRLMIDQIDKGYKAGHVVAVGVSACYEPESPNPSAATRRAITRAAASMAP